MTLARLAFDGVRHYWRTHAAVALGVASAVAVLAGALLVGHSVRTSLRALVDARLGRTQIVVSSQQPFTMSLADRLATRIGPSAASEEPRIVPLVALTGVAQHEPSGRRAHNVLVYGVDQRFFDFHAVPAAAPAGSDALISADLGAELGTANGDSLLLRVTRPTDIPADSLHGRRDEIGKSVRLTTRGVLTRAAMGEFSLAPTQGPVRAVFVPLPRLQRELAQSDRVNTLLIAGLPDGEVGAKKVRDALGPALNSEDLGIRIERLGDSSLIVEAAGGLISEAAAASIQSAASSNSLAATPVLTWLANSMSVGDRATPYSLVSAIGADAIGDTQLAAMLKDEASQPIVLTEWAARDLQASAGQSLTMEFYRWADEGRLVTDTATFRVAGVVPMRGLAVDRRMAPPYPGITEARGIGDWDPPFPIDLKRVRPADEAFWNQYRTSPKAFIPVAAGQRLWGTRYGKLTSVRLRATDPKADLAAITTRLVAAVPAGISAPSAGVIVTDVRTQNAAASAGATDFGAYFSYFSFFLMVSALLLAALFFRLSIEQRLQQIGVLRAMGYPLAAIRSLWLIEGGVVVFFGALIGIGLATAWAAFMMYGLSHWWIGAVGTTDLRLHLSWPALIAGAVGGALAAVGAIALTVRRLSDETPRQLMTGSTELHVRNARRGTPEGLPYVRRLPYLLPAILLCAAVLLSILSGLGVVPAAGGFFGAGMLVLVGGLMAFSRSLGRRRDAVLQSNGEGGLTRLGMRNASWRPGRSVTSAGLVASAVFLIISVDAFRKGASAESGHASGTGGFALFAESALPIVDDLSSAEGRESVGLQMGAADTSLAGVEIFPLRLRPGDDASCLNLYQPAQPRILGVPQRLVDANRFQFAKSVATSDADRQNPWRLLGPTDSDGAVPAIVDATSLQYIFHASIGDVIAIDAATPRPVKLKIVGALADSVLQGEVLIAESAFLALYPQLAGYRVLLVGVTPPTADRVDAVTKVLEDRLDRVGLDAQSTSTRLAAFHRVENTYLSTFQTLGALGLVLGTLGLVAVIARNVFERRRELALLGAAGFSGRDLQRVVAAEHLLLVGAGLVIGTIAAVIAIAPVVFQRGAALPWLPFIWLLVVAVIGLATALLATRSVRKLPLVASLRSE